MKIFLPAFCLLLFVHHSSAISWKCLGCKGAVEAIKFLYKRNATSHEIIEMAVYMCKHFADHDSTICRGITSQFKDSFLYVLEQLLLRPSQLCGLILNDCGEAHNPFDGNWSIDLPPKPNISVPRTHIKVPEKTFRVLQLSDLHFDYSYTPGSEADCKQPICCQRQVNVTSLSSTSINKPAGYWGTLASCDVPIWTIENMLQHINRTEKLDYIMLTGDYMSHSDWTYTKEEHLSVIANFSTLMQKYFPNTPVFWGIGNHEGVPVNSLFSFLSSFLYFAPHFAPAKFQPKWLTYCYLSRILQCVVDRGLKLISVNTGYCETTNFFLYINQTDPDGTLAWLVSELYESERANQSIHIMAHVPPGDGECLEGWSRNYYRVVNRFADTIKAQFFGHVHTDAFTVFYEDMNDYLSQPTNVLYTAPSVTTFENLNPAYRIYTIDGNYKNSSYEIDDFETYFLNLTETKDIDHHPQWKLLYKAKEEYGMTNLSAQSWHDLSQRIRGSKTVYKKFLKNYARRTDYPCDTKCHQELLCSLRRGHHNESALCPSNSVIRKRVFPTVFQRPFPAVETSVSEPLTRDDFIVSTAKKAIWDKITNWISG
uniref:Sphingomyelin phosphodiesterase n=1 Tax=Ditylenchus dipsaci TaxID=166011 RepID=A0A915CRE5_9BILA